jgi:hypothetical protein
VYETQEFRGIGEILSGCGPQCNGTLIRIVSMPQVAPPSPDAYFNYTIGEVCTGTRDFEAKLALNARKMTDADGIERNFQPVYPEEGRKMAEAASTSDAELQRLQ